MHIGFDMQMLRASAGLYYHVWNLYRAVCATATPHRVTPFLYGHPGASEPEGVRQPGESFLREVHYHWEGPRLPLLSRHLRGAPALAFRAARKFDRRVVLPLWKKMADTETATPDRFPLARQVWHTQSAFEEVDLFHHVCILLFPIHPKANVLTIPDMTTRRVPQFHDAKSIDFVEEAFTHAGEMDLIITSSEHTKGDVVDLLGIDEDRIRVTPLAAHEQYRRIEDPEQVEVVLAKYGLAGRPYILTLGTLEPRKNLRRLIEAFHQLKQETPSLEHSLILAGEKGWMAEPIFKTINELRLESQVKWLGKVPFEDLPALLNGADVFVYPSLYEGFGLPPLEAMACGAPVLASRATSLPEVVGDAGVLVDPYRVEEIAEGMHRVLTDRALNAALRDKALARARTFSWQRTARLTWAAYEEARGLARRRFPKRSVPKIVSTKCRKEVRQGIIWSLTQHGNGA
jgi:glycosyltransferase involved in cell wall biosynthesis